jgi:hypothetical protein
MYYKLVNILLRALMRRYDSTQCSQLTTLPELLDFD